MSRTGLVVFGVLIALSLAWAQELPPLLTLRIELRPGPPIGETPEAAAKTPPQTVFEEGQPIDVAFIITNEGTQSCRYFDRAYTTGIRMFEYALQVTDAQGHAQDDPWQLWKGPEFGGASNGSYIDLAPRAVITKHVYLNAWSMPLSPGSYGVRGVYQSHPPVQSVPVEFRIRRCRDMDGYVAALGRELRADDVSRRVQAVKYLGFTGSRRALPFIIALFYDEDAAIWLVSPPACQAFLYMRDARACKDALVTFWDERGPNSFTQVLLSHYHVPLERTLPAAIKALASADWKMRVRAARSLGGYSSVGDAALLPLVKALDDTTPAVRAAAAGALYPYDSPKAVQGMLGASHDPDRNVRFAALWAMARSSGGSGAAAIKARFREMLTETPQDANQIIWFASCGEFPLSPEDLRNGLESPDAMVRIHTAVALLGSGDDSMRVRIAEGLAALEFGDQDRVCLWLGKAAERRRLQRPTFDFSDWRQRRDAWVKWLRQKD